MYWEDSSWSYKRMVDPAGVGRRKRHVLKSRIYSWLGPNDCWHVDGYDKLNPFNFAIHGWIDGHSRNLLWLKVGKSKSNPKIIANYFMDLVTSFKGLSTKRKVRTDCETIWLSCLRAHSYGTCQQNQRIKAWWSLLRGSKTTWMIIYFKRNDR